MMTILKISTLRTISTIGLILGSLIHVPQTTAQSSVRVRVNRWLEVQQLSGRVTYQRGRSSRRARVGDRLQAVGDSVATGGNSSVRLAVDTAVGHIVAHSNTRIRVQSLAVASDNGRVTRLHVSGGQVRVQVRPFTNQGSRLEVVTPSSISGVRGTAFGIAVQPDGKTGLATMDGAVMSSAQGQSYVVPAGFQNLTIAGEPPSPPVPIRNDSSLSYRWQIVLEGDLRRLQLDGEVDPVNLVYVDGNPQILDRQGRFSLRLPMVSSPRYQVTVVTPMGKTQTHDLVF